MNAPPSEEQLQAFADIVKRGGVVVCAPDVFAALHAWTDATGVSLTGVEVRTSKFVAPGVIVAIASRATLTPEPQR